MQNGNNDNTLARLSMGQPVAPESAAGQPTVQTTVPQGSACAPEATNSNTINLENINGCDGLRFILDVNNTTLEAQTIVFGTFLGLPGEYAKFRQTPTAVDQAGMKDSIDGSPFVGNMANLQGWNQIAISDGLIANSFTVFGDADVLKGKLGRFMINAQAELDPITNRLNINYLQQNGIEYTGIIAISSRNGLKFTLGAGKTATFEINIIGVGAAKGMVSPKV